MDVGIFAKTFSRPDLPETLDAVVAAGLTTIQFNMALTAGGRSMPDDIPLALATQVRDEVARRDLKMAAVTLQGIEFAYRSTARAMALLEHVPSK